MKDNKTARKAPANKPWGGAKSTRRSAPDRAAYILDKNTDFAYVEAYNHLRTNVMFALAAADTGNILNICYFHYSHLCKKVYLKSFFVKPPKAGIIKCQL